MSEALSTVIVALISAVFGVITVLIQKRQDKVINKIDEQTMFIEKEKGLNQKIKKKEKEVQGVVNDIMLLTLETNLSILGTIQVNGEYLFGKDHEVYKKASELRQKFIDKHDEIEELEKEYQIVLDMTSQFKSEIQKLEKNKK